MNPPIDVLPEPEAATDLALTQKSSPPAKTTQVSAVAQAKTDAIAALTQSAYARASDLRLTKEETDIVNADFPDEAFRAGAGGKDNLIYIEHAYLRDRLNQAFGPGQWAIVPRSRWSEDYIYRDTHGKDQKAACVYV